MWFDFPVLDFIQENIRNGFLDPIMKYVSYFGAHGIGWIVLGLALLIPRKTRAAAATALCALALGFILGDLVIKPLVCRVRPYDAYEAYHVYAMSFTLNAGTEHSYSFPSGHATCAFASAVAYFKLNKKVGIALTVFAALIAFSRLYNYVHFPTDVLAGMALGISAGLLMI